jgi:hypothetical protein
MDEDVCTTKMTVQECEMAILRHSIDETEKIQKTKMANAEDVKRMISILEDFVRRKKRILYGGTATNNILPESAQFYDRDVEIPDYDMFSDSAQEDAKELADIYYKAGFTEVDAKSGVHKGTYKVFVSYTPMADITQLHPKIYASIQKDAIVIDGIHYAPPNYLRMGMFLELSRPAGDTSRWEKVFKRLTLLNTHYPLKSPYNCQKGKSADETNDKIFALIRQSLVNQEVVFFGGYAASLYTKYTGHLYDRRVPDFDVISEDPKKCADVIKEQLIEANIRGVKIIRHENLDDVIPEHYEVAIKGQRVLLIFKPIACYNYNVLKIAGHNMKIATMDTMLSFYLAFVYSGQPYFDSDRIMCMAQMLFDLQQKNKTNSKGLLKRFGPDCYGTQPTLATIRAEKSEKFKEFKERNVNRGSHEWNEWFFKYSPGDEKEPRQQRRHRRPRRATVRNFFGNPARASRKTRRGYFF